MLGDAFYLTGSSIEDTGIGFDSSLSSKTILRLELPLNSKSTLFATTASSYYYNNSTKKFDAITASLGSWASLTYGRALGYNNDRASISNAKDIASPTEEMLFGPLGKISTLIEPTMEIVTGAVATMVRPRPNLNDVFFSKPRSYSKPVATSPLSEDITTPSSSYRIPASAFINQPFLIEKCVIELPFEAGPGWFNDSTQTTTVGLNNGAGDGAYITDIGGPAITVGLFNYFGSDTKDLILSATIIPEKDDRRNLYISTVNTGSTPAGSLLKIVRNNTGFRCFSTPTAVVKRPTNSQFSGSIRLFTKPSVTIGTTSAFFAFARAVSASLIAGDRANYLSASLARSSMFIQTLAGRSKSGGLQSISGRSIFGKTTKTPSIKTTPIMQDLYDASGTVNTNYDDMVLYQSERTQVSPYLLMPNDQLWVTLSKYRSAFVSSSTTSGPLQSTASGSITALSSYLYQSSSHDVSIPTGSLKITLYGSLVREGVEAHNTLNSYLNTNQAHEAIGMEPIVDEFDVSYATELSESYHSMFKVLDAVPSLQYGSRFVITDNLPNKFARVSYSHIGDQMGNVSWSNQYGYTQARKISEIQKGSSRFAVHKSEELFWDCRVPDPQMAWQTCNPNFAVWDDISWFLSPVAVVFSGLTSSYADDGNYSLGCGVHDWYMTYPYEPKFSNVQTRFSDNMQNDVWDYNQGAISRRKKSVTYDSIWLELGSSGNRIVYSEGNISTGDGYAGIGMADFVRVVYGFGKGRGAFDNGHVRPRVSVYSFGEVQGADIRGWRYGMMSGFPTFSTAVYRRERYGQFRDMLEQRIDGKFYNRNQLSSNILDSPVQVKFVDAGGNSVLPEETMSSNLSFEATSSIPYTDGIVRNREEPMSFAKINQAIVVI
jgi:hypothetical protein